MDLVSDLHHASAGEGDDEHKRPLGNEVEDPEKVAKRDGQAKLGGLAVEGVPEGLEQDKVLLVASLLQLHNLVRSDGGKVKSLLVDVDGGGLWEHVEGPDVANVGGPGIAKDGLVVAVEDAHVRSGWELRKLGSSTLESGFKPVTAA